MEVLGFVISSKRSTTMWGGVCLILSSIMVISLTIIMYGDSYFMNKHNGGFFKAHFKGEPNQFQEDAQNATSCRAAIEGAAATATPPAPAPAPPQIPRDVHDSPATLINKTLIHGLLASGFDHQSCLSRYQSYLLRRSSSLIPSQDLLHKLRAYEDLHRRCGPHTGPYNRTMRLLLIKRTRNVTLNDTKTCKYVLWRGANGLGNRMVSIAGTFLYAVLTDRVLLVEFHGDMTGLFCQPFLNSSWYLPEDFPYKGRLSQVQRYEKLVYDDHDETRNRMEVNNIIIPWILFLDLELGGGDRIKYFHCDHSQSLLQKVPVLILSSDQYIAPSLFMVPSFKQELWKLFPRKDTVFHHLGRYLFHPTNEAWGLIVRFYQAYLAKADERIGLQIRVFNPQLTPPRTIMDQLLACTLKHNLLPEMVVTDHDLLGENTTISSKAVAILVASLNADYADNLKAMYWTRPTANNVVVGVHQASHEGKQMFGSSDHQIKAWVEIYLLSLCDVLVTSGLSTFGYVAQSLGGLRPWIMEKSLGTTFSDPPCKRALSMEPCFHCPPKYTCEAKTKVDHISTVFPHMRQCQDFPTGVKLVDDP
ncbi:hypothetical protein Dimus_007104 [Dionaea muscipula]